MNRRYYLTVSSRQHAHRKNHVPPHYVFKWLPNDRMLHDPDVGFPFDMYWTTHSSTDADEIWSRLFEPSELNDAIANARAELTRATHEEEIAIGFVCVPNVDALSAGLEGQGDQLVRILPPIDPWEQEDYGPDVLSFGWLSTRPGVRRERTEQILYRRDDCDASQLVGVAFQRIERFMGHKDVLLSFCADTREHDDRRNLRLARFQFYEPAYSGCRRYARAEDAAAMLLTPEETQAIEGIMSCPDTPPVYGKVKQFVDGYSFAHVAFGAPHGCVSGTEEAIREAGFEFVGYYNLKSHELAEESDDAHTDDKKTLTK
jgi:hypothetical protein